MYFIKEPVDGKWSEKGKLVLLSSVYQKLTQAEKI